VHSLAAETGHVSSLYLRQMVGHSVLTLPTFKSRTVGPASASCLNLVDYIHKKLGAEEKIPSVAFAGWRDPPPPFVWGVTHLNASNPVNVNIAL
jgi:hypothetical protein